MREYLEEEERRRGVLVQASVCLIEGVLQFGWRTPRRGAPDLGRVCACEGV